MNHILPSHFEANSKQVYGSITSTTTVCEIDGERYVFNYAAGYVTVMKMLKKESSYAICFPVPCTPEETARVKMFVFNMWQILFAEMTKPK